MRRPDPNGPPGPAKLRRLQERLRISQIVLAEQIGIGQSVLSRYMAGELVPGLKQFCLLRDFAKRHRVTLVPEDFVPAIELRRAA